MSEDKNMISDEAVEAAAEWLPHSGDCEVRPERDCTCWRPRLALMRAALEAAAPYIAERAYNVGHFEGMTGATKNNPYRSQA